MADAVNNAKWAQKEWTKTSFRERRRVLRMLLRYIVKHGDDIARGLVLRGERSLDLGQLLELPGRPSLELGADLVVAPDAAPEEAKADRLADDQAELLGRGLAGRPLDP